VKGKLDTLGDECGQPLGLGFGKVDVLARASLSAGKADGKPTVAGREHGLGLDKRADRIGSGEFAMAPI
jgi:hypothetical protein